VASQYQRFEAVDGRAVAHEYATKLLPGELGTWLTHERVYQANTSTDAHLHIIDDDVILAQDPEGKLEAVLGQADLQFTNWDLIFTEMLVPIHTDYFQLFFERMKFHAQSGDYTILDLCTIPFSGASSFFVNKQSVGKVLSLVSGKWTQDQGIDVYIAQLVHQGLLKAYVTIPFLTSLSPHHRQSDIRGSWDRGHCAREVYRRAFFVEGDPNSVLLEMQQLTQGAGIPPLASIYAMASLYFFGVAAGSSVRPQQPGHLSSG
jgi:GR25 family glycosyltransferase involved in LPS biosynthesis